MPALPVLDGRDSERLNDATSEALAEMRASVARILSTGRARATMKRTDSGSIASMASASTSGAMPPSASTLRQPNWGISQAARKPPNAAPSGKPQNIALVSVARSRSGQYSLISVTALGMAAPRPRPVSKRSAVSCSSDCANDEARQAMPKTSTAATSSILRPSQSASGPDASAPKARPNSAALRTGASAGLVTPHSLTSDGAMKPMAAVSKPSSSTITKHSPKIIHWKPENRCSLRNDWTSTLWRSCMACLSLRCGHRRGGSPILAECPCARARERAGFPCNVRYVQALDGDVQSIQAFAAMPPHPARIGAGW